MLCLAFSGFHQGSCAGGEKEVFISAPVFCSAMAFEDIPYLPSAKVILESALTKGRKKAASVKKRKADTPLTLARKKERERIIAITQDLAERLKTIPKHYPDLDTLNEFYRELLKNDFSLDEYRKRLSRAQNTPRSIAAIRDSVRGKIEAAQSPEDVKKATNAFIGRTSGAIMRIEDDLEWLEDVRKRLRTYPKLKELFTVCIAGFPNVGKTTLLKALTGASAEINEYAFTTKSLNLGYKTVNARKIQFVDTPGTLNREHMNEIEMQAHLALKYVADVIVYVYDFTESYALSDQHELRAALDEHAKPVLHYLSKQDLISEEEFVQFKAQVNGLSQQELVDAIEKHVIERK